jgi:hypothetical protein
MVFLLVSGTIYRQGLRSVIWGPSGIGFEKVQFSRLTSSGNILNVVISPDGNYAAYVTYDDDGQGVCSNRFRPATRGN